MRWGVVVGLLLALPLLGACEQDMSDLKTYVAKVKARKSAQIEPIPKMQPYEPFTYEPGERREPFAPFQEGPDLQPQREVSGVSPDFKRPRGPLEAFPLDALRMQGTLTVADTRYALIKAPDGVVYRVGKGAHMGQNYGEVVAVDQQGVRLTEIIPNGQGGYLRRDASIALSDSEGTNPR
ncbi:MAG: pilus assembly protein PilP [Salinisphaera sp.]|nr:pilus assembly protein PilP [Salinisphaera sp.]